MTGLYEQGYRPSRLSKRYEATGIAITGAGQAADVMRRYGVPEHFGDPLDAVAFLDVDSGAIGALTCDYANGRRAEYRQTQKHWRLTFTRTPASGEQA